MMAISLFKASIIFAIIGAILAFVFIYIGVNKLKQGSFTLTFHTYERSNEECLYLGSPNLTSSTLPIFKLLLNKKLSIVVNNEISQDILESIGSIIIDCQNGNTNTPNTDSNFDL